MNQQQKSKGIASTFVLLLGVVMFAGCVGNQGGDDGPLRARFTPAIDLSACNVGNATLSLGAVAPDLNGDFSDTWPSSAAARVDVNLQITTTTFFGTLKCSTSSANGVMSGTLDSGGYGGHYSFGAQTGNVSLEVFSNRGNNNGGNDNGGCGQQGCDSGCQGPSCGSNDCGNQGCNQGCQGPNCGYNDNNCGNQGCNQGCQGPNCGNNNCGPNGCQNNCGPSGCNDNCGPSGCNDNGGCTGSGCVNDGCGGCSTSPYAGTWKSFHTLNTISSPDACGGLHEQEIGQEFQDNDLYVDQRGDLSSTKPGEVTTIRGHIEFSNGQLTLTFDGQNCSGGASGSCSSTNACQASGNVAGNSISVRLERGASSSTSSPATTTAAWSPAGTWTVSFSPPINVSSCTGGTTGSGYSWNSQTFSANAGGGVSAVWSPDRPNTLNVEGGLGSDGFQLQLSCGTPPPNGGNPTGVINGGRAGDGYSGSYSFYAKTGSVTLTRSGGPSPTSPSSSSPPPSSSSAPTPTTTASSPTTTPSGSSTSQIVIKSDATTLAAGLGDAGTHSDATLARLDAGDVSGLTFQAAAVGQFGTYTSVPSGAPAGTQIVNIPPGDGRNGFFKVTFTLPSGFSSPSLAGSANVDDFGRAFLNGHALSPSLFGSDPQRLSQYGNAAFSTSNLSNFRVGTNELLISDANTNAGPSGAGFYATVTFQT